MEVCISVGGISSGFSYLRMKLLSYSMLMRGAPPQVPIGQQAVRFCTKMRKNQDELVVIAE
jgi:hypothetical protein